MAFGFTYTLPTIVGSHTDFPVLLKTVDFPSAAIDGTANALANGGGDLVAYTDDTKTTQLPVEVVTFVSSGSPDAEVWVKIPTAATSNTIFIEADAVQTSQPATSSTYGRDAVWADYIAVWHCDTTTDSTGNSHTLTLNGSPSVVAANVFGNAYDLNGTTGNLEVADHADLDLASNFTLQAIFTSDVTDQNNYTHLAKSSANTTGYRYFNNAGRSFRVRHPELTGANLDTAAQTITIGQDMWIAAVFNGTTRESVLDGVSLASDTPSGTVTGNTDSLLIGGASYLGWFDGQVDEARVMNTGRSVAWLLVEYNNQSTVTTWGTVGSWDEPTDGASGQIILPSLVVGGLTQLAYSSDGQAILPSLTLNGLASSGFDGVGAVTLPSIFTVGNADTEYVAAGAFDLPSLFVAGIASASALIADADGNILLPNLVVGGDANGGGVEVAFSKPFTSEFTTAFTVH